ncbi:uncharacterized [Tachysurus ichikawai]
MGDDGGNGGGDGGVREDIEGDDREDGGINDGRDDRGDNGGDGEISCGKGRLRYFKRKYKCLLNRATERRERRCLREIAERCGANIDQQIRLKHH